VTGRRPQLSALAAVSAVARSVQDIHDSQTLFDRSCKSIAVNLGFDRAAIARCFTDSSRLEVAAAEGVALREATLFVSTAAMSPWLQRARATRAPVLFDNSRAGAIFSAARRGASVIVPLFAGDRCLGFLAAEREGPGFGEPVEAELLTTLGAMFSTLLANALAYDVLVGRDRRKSEFVALASHELRTPSAAVCALAATLRGREGSMTEGQRRDLHQVLDEQGQRLHRLVEQLLDLSRLDETSIRNEPTPLAVRERTEQLVRAIAGERADEIEVVIESSLRAEADPDAFDHIVSNLIGNALRYGQPPIAVSAMLQDRHFRLTVEDRGRGVPSEFAPRLFERFTRAGQSEAKGAGLGLSIAQAYAHAQGGELLYEDAKPHGARFQFVVPVASASSGAEEAR